MAFLAPFAPLLIAGAVGAGGGLLAAKAFGSKKTAAPALKPTPKAPSAEDALAKAKAEAEKRRRVSLLSGGQTRATGPLGVTVPAGAATQKRLLGN